MRSLRLRMSRCSSAVGRRGGCPPGIVNHARTAHERTKIAHVHHQALTGGRGRERGRPRFGTAGVVCRSARRFSAIAAIVAGTRERVFLYNFLCIATGLAFVYRGNRAFCKCVCPATVFLRVDKAASLSCGKCRPHGACHKRRKEATKERRGLYSLPALRGGMPAKGTEVLKRCSPRAYLTHFA